jgi:hypothetical protein
MEILKFIALFVTIVMGTINIARIIYKVKVPAPNFIYFGLGLSTFLFLQFHL